MGCTRVWSIRVPLVCRKKMRKKKQKKRLEGKKYSKEKKTQKKPANLKKEDKGSSTATKESRGQAKPLAGLKTDQGRAGSFWSRLLWVQNSLDHELLALTRLAFLNALCRRGLLCMRMVPSVGYYLSKQQHWCSCCIF